ncbi:hypothetical protein DPMN_133186 [Dreissena polymorpha]|uniref:Uncharacterized protein n=1 Tax=Dreissena polymorpha TaxID=45954 RepID=A0A9D4FT23_DREPO|nr:hypothetical protein DPMN_133186 [Dreissena polymorpha]
MTQSLTAFNRTDNFAHLRRCLQTKCGRTDSGQRPILKPHLSNQAKNVTSIVKTAPPPPYIYKTNLFTKFHDDWAKNVTSRVKLLPPGSNVIQLTETIFQLNSLLTCFHYIHLEKNAPPTGGRVFSPIWTIFELVREINKTNVYYSQIRKTAPPTDGHVFQRTGTTFELNQRIIKTNILTNVTSTDFELDRDFIRTKLLTKFHEDRTINVASRVFTNKC